MRYKHIVIMTLLAASMTGCGWEYSHWDEGTVGHILIQDGFESGQDRLIQDAAFAWQTDLNQFVRFDFEEGYDHNILIFPSTVSALSHDWGDEEIPIVAGHEKEHYNHDMYIDLSVDLSDDYFVGVAEHELGHALGLSHQYGPDKTIMCFDDSCSSHHVTCRDVEQFCLIWNCNWTKLPICKAESINTCNI